MLDEGLEMADSCGVSYYSGWAHRLLGEIAQKANPDKAEIHFEKSITVLGQIRAENELAQTFASYGRFKMQQGQFSEAREYLTKAIEVFERLGTLMEPGKLRDILAEVPEADIR
jgi:tetratricopeptide (TPR) repeat protein